MRSLMNCYMFPYRIDYITTYSVPTASTYLSVLIKMIVVEPSSIQGLAADYPILIIFKHSRLTLFHVYVVVYKALRDSQQFNGFFNIDFSIKSLTKLTKICFLFNFSFLSAPCPGTKRLTFIVGTRTFFRMS